MSEWWAVRELHRSVYFTLRNVRFPFRFYRFAGF